MESRVLGLLGVFLFIVCFAGYISYAGELDSKRRELQEAASGLESSKKGLDSRENLLHSMMEQVNTLQEHADKFNSLTKDKQVLTSKITELEETRKKILKDFIELVQKVRVSSEGMELATVTLNGGQVLQGVKLQKFTDTTVSLSHSNGLIKVEGKELPEDLKKRFRYGMEPFVSAPVNVIVQSSPDPAPTPKSGTPASHLQIEIDALEQKIAQLDKSKLEWSSVADSYRSQAYSAQSMGRPAYTFRAQEAQANQNVQTINGQIAKLQEEQVVLRKRMANAMAVP